MKKRTWSLCIWQFFRFVTVRLNFP